MNTVAAAGILLLTREQPHKFLLMKHPDRWDLPKGHCEPGESLRQTALRETMEETGIPIAEIHLDEHFEFALEYQITGAKRGNYLKQVTYFLGFIDREREILPTEHPAYQWFPWPSGPIQSQTIDPLLTHLQQHLARTT